MISNWKKHLCYLRLYINFSALQGLTLYPANTTRWNNDVLMLAQRLRRWPNIKTSLFQRVVFAGIVWKIRYKLFYMECNPHNHSLQGTVRDPCAVACCLLGKSEIVGSNPAPGFKFQRNKMFLLRSLVKIQGSNLESCVWRAVSCHSYHHPQEVLLAQFSLFVHNSGLKPHSFSFFQLTSTLYQMV